MKRINTPPLKLVSDSLAHPTALERVLKKHGDISVDLRRRDNVDATSVIHWHELGENAHPFNETQGWLLGWHLDHGVWTSYDHYSPSLESLMVEDGDGHWTCDIRDVKALSVSKSELRDFSSLDAFAESLCKGLLADESPEGLAKNLEWPEIRIIHGKDSSDFFEYYGWDQRVLLCSTGVSHHFSGGSDHFIAARYLAGKLNTPVPLTGKIREYCLSYKAVCGLREEFDLFAIKSGSILLEDMAEALREFEAEFCLMSLPRPLSDNKVIMLPKGCSRSVAVSKFLAKAGLQELGEHLSALCENQNFVL